MGYITPLFERERAFWSFCEWDPPSDAELGKAYPRRFK